MEKVECGQIHAPYGANRKKTIVGRGASSKGRTSGRGSNGQNSRSGGGVRPGFEGGHMPLYRRVARRGFSNYPFKRVFQAVSLSDLERVYENGETVSPLTLREKGLIKGFNTEAKILANGTISKALTIDCVNLSATAEESIKKAGGTIVDCCCEECASSEEPNKDEN